MEKQKTEALVPRWQQWLVLILPLLLYANTFNHDFALDDAIVYTDNEFVQQGIAGMDDILLNESFVGYFGKQKSLLTGGRYRPLSLLTFALEKEVFGMNPTVSHLVNVLLYALTGWLMLLVLARLIRPDPNRTKWKDVFPLAATVLFLVHPVHTEAVANIKSRDELLALLFSLWALWQLLLWLEQAKVMRLVSAGLLLLLALLAKESAYPMLVALPAALWLFRKPRWKALIIASLPLALAATCGLALRWQVLGGFEAAKVPNLMNDPFLWASATERAGTIVYTLLVYLRLWVFPWPLTYDYYPFHISYHSLGEPLILAGLALYGLLLAASVVGFFKRSIPAAGLLLYFLTLLPVANIFFTVGTFMNERFLYLPSLGLSIATAWLVVGFPLEKKTWSNFRQFLRTGKPFSYLLLLVVGVFSVMTVSRNPVWKDNPTLFLHDVSVSEGSAKAQNAAGGVLYDLARKEWNPQKRKEFFARSKEHLLKAVAIYPDYAAAWTTLGNDYYYLDHDYDKAIEAYLRAHDQLSLNNLEGMGNMALKDRQYTAAIKCFRTLVKVKPGKAHYLYLTGNAWLEAGQVDSARIWLNRALERNPQLTEAWIKLGLLHARNLRDPEQGLKYFDKALETDPDNAEALENKAIVLAITGRTEEALQYFLKALDQNPGNPNLLTNIGNAYLELGDETRAQHYFDLARQNHAK